MTPANLFADVYSTDGEFVCLNVQLECTTPELEHSLLNP